MIGQHEEQNDSTWALQALAGKRPSAAVERRIVEKALARRSSRFSPAKLFTGLALAGAATAALLVTVQVRTSTPVAPPASADLEAPQAGALREAGRFAIGPHVIDVGSEGSVRFASVDPKAAELRVQAGSAHFEVEHLAAGESFRVHTEQVLVEVVGTRFEVAAQGECSSVSVAEGRVRVTEPAGVRYLSAGESGRFCAPRAAEAGGAGEALVREALVLVSQGQELGKAAALLERYRQEHASGPFAEEALFHLTLVKARQGEKATADRLAAEFRSRFPESRRVQRLDQWLQRVGN